MACAWFAVSVIGLGNGHQARFGRPVRERRVGEVVERDARMDVRGWRQRSVPSGRHDDDVTSG